MLSALIKNITSLILSLKNIGKKKTKEEVKFQKSPLTVDTSFEKYIFVVTPIIGDN